MNAIEKILIKTSVKRTKRHGKKEGNSTEDLQMVVLRMVTPPMM
jgi:hypothetical protein